MSLKSISPEDLKLFCDVEDLIRLTVGINVNHSNARCAEKFRGVYCSCLCNMCITATISNAKRTGDLDGLLAFQETAGVGEEAILYREPPPLRGSFGGVDKLRKAVINLRGSKALTLAFSKELVDDAKLVE